MCYLSLNQYNVKMTIFLNSTEYGHFSYYGLEFINIQYFPVSKFYAMCNTDYDYYYIY